MKVESIDLKDAQSQMKELVQRVSEGFRVILRDNEKPVAELRAVVERKPGLHAGSIWTSDDFDEPLPDDYWAPNK